MADQQLRPENHCEGVPLHLGGESVDPVAFATQIALETLGLESSGLQRMGGGVELTRDDLRRAIALLKDRQPTRRVGADPQNSV